MYTWGYTGGFPKEGATFVSPNYRHPLQTGAFEGPQNFQTSEDVDLHVASRAPTHSAEVLHQRPEGLQSTYLKR